MQFKVNGKPVTVNVEGSTPLLWVLREQLGLTGTKFGCGVMQCGACTVHINGEATRSCLKRVVDVKPDDEVTTIEGLAAPNGKLHPVQQAWIDEQVPQCGYCQSGQIMLACSLLKETPNPDDDTIIGTMTDNYCRCGTYPQIVAAIKRAAGAAGGGGGQ